MPILALDVGSSSVRAMLYENLPEGVQRIPDALAQRKFQFDTEEAGQSTVDPEFLRDLLEQCIDEILQYPAAQTIEAVGMATFAGNWMLFTSYSTFVPKTELFTYADSRSATITASAYMDKAEAAQQLQRLGAPFHSAYWPAQIIMADISHFSQVIPGQTMPHLADFATYIYSIWFSQEGQVHNVPMSYSMASWSGILNRKELAWDKQWTHLADKRSWASLADFTQAQLGLNENYAKRWPALANVPFYLAVGDGAAAQVGSGAVEVGTAALTIGTTAAIRKVSTEALPPVPSGCWSYRIDKEHHLTGGALSEGGNIFAWAKETFNLEAVDIEAQLSQREPDSHGLTVLPLLNGERSPNWRGDATGTIHGLRLSTEPIDIVHALLEAVALRLAYIANQLELTESTHLMAAGGALQASPAWAQIIANALGREIYVMDEPEITSLGVAQLVHAALKGEKITGAKPKIAKIYKPNSNHFLRYNEAQERQNELYKRLYS
jgi:gluconokinase